MTVKAQIRFDYKARVDRSRFLWRRFDPRENAKKIIAKQVALLWNLPFQGLNVEKIDAEHEVYFAPTGEFQEETAYAPLEMIVQADSLADLMPLTLREEFRKIKVIEPKEVVLSNGDLERFLFRVSEEYRAELD